MSQITVRNPTSGDVRVVPAELRHQYESRGFEISAGPAHTKRQAKAPAKKAAAKAKGGAKPTAAATPAAEPAPTG